MWASALGEFVRAAHIEWIERGVSLEAIGAYVEAFTDVFVARMTGFSKASEAPVQDFLDQGLFGEERKWRVALEMCERSPRPRATSHAKGIRLQADIDREEARVNPDELRAVAAPGKAPQASMVMQFKNGDLTVKGGFPDTQSVVQQLASYGFTAEGKHINWSSWWKTPTVLARAWLVVTEDLVGYAHSIGAEWIGSGGY
jgi:hypothetical protein